MLAILGILVVFLAIVTGFVLEKGNLWVLVQPAELIIVGGAAVGIVLAANRPVTIWTMLRGVFRIFLHKAHNRTSYLEVLRMLYELFTYGRRVGVLALESEAERPAEGKVLPSYPRFLDDEAALAFLCEGLRMIVTGGTSSEELEKLMALDIEVQQKEQHVPVNALGMVADSLPGLGIVAAVLGVVVTMQTIGAAPEQVGQKVAAALVGTFLGILLCYGVVGPLASHMEQQNDGRGHLLQLLRAALLAHSRGTSPMLAVEFARRALPLEVRPSFEEMEQMLRSQAVIPSQDKPEEPAKAPAQQNG